MTYGLFINDVCVCIESGKTQFTVYIKHPLLTHSKEEWYPPPFIDTRRKEWKNRQFQVHPPLPSPRHSNK